MMEFFGLEGLTKYVGPKPFTGAKSWNASWPQSCYICSLDKSLIDRGNHAFSISRDVHGA